MHKCELPMQFILWKHLQVIVSRLGCSCSKKLRRNWTAVAIVLFLLRAPLGLSSLRPVKSHCSKHMTHSIRPQLMHLPTFARVCISCICSARIFLWLFAVPCSWGFRKSRHGSNAQFLGSCLAALHFPTNTWIHDMALSMPDAQPSPSSARVPWVSINICQKIHALSINSVSKGNIIQQISPHLIT